MLCAAVLDAPAHAQSAAPDLPDPRKCVVVVDDAGEVGLRIADAQMAHELVVSHLRKRLGTDAVVYDGARKSAAAMKRMLGPNAETTIQDAQLAYFEAAAKAAPFRVRVRFGQAKGEHWITVACRKVDGDPRKPLDERRFTGKTFLAARDAAAAGLDGFCPQLPSTMAAIPVEGATPGEVPGLRKKDKSPTPWTPPPRRD